MATDMKMAIAEAAGRLLLEKNVKKLTVKDIVEECQITRQTFYYHFQDIPEMFQWILERNTEQLMKELRAQGDAEKELRYFFLAAVNAGSYLKKGVESNYGNELQRLLEQHIYRLFETAVEERNMYRGSSRSQLKLILRYHSQAVLGILRGWTKADTENLDEIVHQVYLLMLGKISPFSEEKN